MAATTTRTVRIVVDASAAVSGGKDVERALTGVEGAVKRLQSSLNPIGSALGGLRQNFDLLRNALVAFAAIRVAQVVAGWADEFTNATSKLKLVTTSTAELVRVQDALFQSAQRTRNDFGSVVALYSNIARASKDLGLSEAQRLQITENVSKAFTIAGASAGTMRGALVQLGQALGAGALRGDEFNSIAEAAPPILDAVAKQMGVSRGALRGLAAEGQITSEIFAKALLGATKDLNDQFANIAPTISGAVTNVHSALVNLVGQIDRTSSASSGVAGSIQKIADVLSSPQFITAAAAAFKALADVLAFALRNVELLLPALTTLMGLRIGAGIGALIGSGLGPLGAGVGAAVGALVGIAGDWVIASNSAATSTGTFSGALDDLGGSATEAQAQLAKMTEFQLRAKQASLAATVQEQTNKLASLNEELSGLAGKVDIMSDLAEASKQWGGALDPTVAKQAELLAQAKAGEITWEQYINKFVDLTGASGEQIVKLQELARQHESIKGALGGNKQALDLVNTALATLIGQVSTASTTASTAAGNFRAMASAIDALKNTGRSDLSRVDEQLRALQDGGIAGLEAKKAQIAQSDRATQVANQYFKDQAKLVGDAAKDWGDYSTALANNNPVAIAAAKAGNTLAAAEAELAKKTKERQAAEALAKKDDKAGDKADAAFATDLRRIDDQIAGQQRLSEAYASGSGAVLVAQRETEKLNAISDLASKKYGPAEVATIRAKIEALYDLKAANEAAAEVSGIRQGISRDSERAQLELDLLGKTNEARNVELRLLEIKNQLVDKGNPDAAAVAESFRAQVEGAEHVNAVLERQRAAADAIAGTFSQAFDRVGASITDAFTKGEASAVSFQSVVDGVLSEVLQSSVKLAVLNPLKNALFGGNDPTIADVGGIIGGWFGNKPANDNKPKAANENADLASVLSSPSATIATATLSIGSATVNLDSVPGSSIPNRPDAPISGSIGSSAPIGGAGADTLQQAGDKIATTANTFGDTFGGVLGRLAQGMSGSSNVFVSGFGSILSALLQGIQSITNSGGAGGGGFFSSVGTFLSGLIGGTGGAGAGFDPGGLISAGVYHGGGVAGQPKVSRLVATSEFNGAPRYHKGGIAGDEVAAILRRGERIVANDNPRDWMAAQRASDGGAGRAPQVVNNFNVENHTGQPVEQRQQPNSTGGVDYVAVIGNAAAAELGRRGSPMAKSMQQNWGGAPALRGR